MAYSDVGEGTGVILELVDQLWEPFVVCGGGALLGLGGRDLITRNDTWSNWRQLASIGVNWCQLDIYGSFMGL